jgi:hypothetical protein
MVQHNFYNIELNMKLIFIKGSRSFIQRYGQSVCMVHLAQTNQSKLNFVIFHRSSTVKVVELMLFRSASAYHNRFFLLLLFLVG